MGKAKPGAAKIAPDNNRVKEVKPASNPRRGRKLSTPSEPIKKSKSIREQPPGPQQQGSGRKSKPKTTPKSSKGKKKGKKDKPEIQRDDKGRFPPGISGNPGGRVTGVTISKLRRQDGKRLCSTAPYAKKFCKALGIDPKKTTIEELVAAQANFNALAESQYYRENLNRDEGKVVERVMNLDAYTPLKEASEEDIKKALRAARDAEKEEPDAQ